MFRLTIVLAVCLALVSANEHHEEQENKPRAVRAIKGMMKNARSKSAQLRSKLSPSNELAEILGKAHTEEEKKAALSKHLGVNAKHEKHSLRSADEKHHDHHNHRQLSHNSPFMIARYRPNSDCSGEVTTMIGYGLDTCDDVPNSAWSQKYACERDYNSRGDEVKSITRLLGIFDNKNCEGEPFQVQSSAVFPKCAMDLQNFNKTGPQMVAYQCAPDAEVFEKKEGSLMITIHQTSDCSDQPIQIQSIFTGACTLSVDFNSDSDDDDGDDTVLDEDSEFSYAR
eukprot:CAMPEP_0175011238 /NCGR_PEP_ID=MMETSP0005-20121125/8548_1 /TAXON_ID=420556 /ORGANISM="Ochromonas sp., Strain CCMP1393" /LENGTH=282 /DNA_ID=CAMNT_0016267153 /DNA_START=34 /DNA_END=879 /DNA_ORIENTATION=+